MSGQNAANIALGMGADVTLLDTDLDKLRMSFWRYDNQVHGLASSRLAVQQQVLEADMVIGAVLIPGAAAPKLVTNDLVAQMKPGSVLVDIAIDQGGCFEDSRPTTHADPTFECTTRSSTASPTCRAPCPTRRRTPSPTPRSRMP